MNIACGTADRCENCPARLLNNSTDEDQCVVAVQAVLDAYGAETVRTATYAKREVLIADVTGDNIPAHLRGPASAILQITSNGGCEPTNLINQ